MAQFLGEYDCKLDAKGRMVLPARFKAQLPADDQKIIIKKGLEPCLLIYPVAEWQSVYEQVASLNEFKKEFRRFQRSFLRGSIESELDANGRILLPKSMLGHAGLDKDAIVIGMANRIEIWSQKLYEEHIASDEEAQEELAEKILGNTLSEQTDE